MALASQMVVAQNQPGFVPGRLLVQFRPTATAEQVRNLVANAHARAVAILPQIGVHVLQLPAGANETATARAFAQHPGVVFAEPDWKSSPSGVTVNDPYYGSQWHLPKIACSTAWSSASGNNVI